MLFEGMFAAITTPFYADGRLYPLKLRANVDRYNRTALAGMVVLGSTGEAVLLREDEQAQVLTSAMAEASAAKVMIAGVGQESVAATLAMAGHAARLNYDAVLVRTPYYYRRQMRDAEMLHFFRAVADASALPLLLYSNPACTGYELPVELIADLACHPNILGIKDSSNNPGRIGEIVTATAQIRRKVTVTPTFAAVTERMVQLASQEAGANLVQLESMGGGALAVAPTVPSMKTRARDVGFQVLSGSAGTLQPALLAGASGAVLALAACAPQACYEVYAASREGDELLAAVKQQRLLPAAKHVVEQMGVPGVKYAAELNGYYGGYPRAPLLPLTTREKDEVAALMQDLRA